MRVCVWCGWRVCGCLCERERAGNEGVDHALIEDLLAQRDEFSDGPARDERQTCGDGALHILEVFGTAHHEFELLDCEASHVVHAKVAVAH